MKMKLWEVDLYVRKISKLVEIYDIQHPTTSNALQSPVLLKVLRFAVF